MSELLQIFDPRRNLQLQGFTGRGATTTLHDATATGVSISGIFQAAEDFAVLGFYNAYDYFNHLRQKHLPRTDLSGLVLEFDIEYDHALDGAMRLDAAKYPSVSWDSMTFVCGKGGPSEIHEVKLLSYATVVSGGETPASVSVDASGTQPELGADHIAVTFRDTVYDCIPRGKLYQLPKSLSSPNGTIDLWPSDLDPVTGGLELKVGDTVYFTYDPLYPADPPYQLEEICHVIAIDPVYKNRVTFDNTLPHGGEAICRSYTPGPFNIVAASNDTLPFIIDGSSIYIGLTAGAAQTADQVAADINTAVGAAGLDATADTVDGCVRITSTKPVGAGEIVAWGGTGLSTIGFVPGTYAGSGPQFHVHALATAESAIKDLADTINGGGKNVVVTGPDQSSVIQATASGKTLTIAFKTSPPPATVMGKLGNGEILTVRSWHETVPVDARDASYDASKDVQGVTFGANRSVRFSGGDNDTKYHISVPLGALTDKSSQTVPTVDCRKMYMVFAPRFEIVEEALEDGCFLTAGVGPGDTTWSVDSGAALTGGRYFIGDATTEERVLLVAGGASAIQVQRGYESSTPGSWPAGTRMKKLPPISGFQSDVEWGATISNIAVTGDASLKVGGDSARIEESDRRCQYVGYWEAYKYGDVTWPSQWWSKGHARRTGPNDLADVRAVTIQYSATEEHDLYLGTFLYTDCGKVGVTVDGVAPAESPVDLYLNEYGGTTASVKIASAVPAGNHTVVLTALFERNAASTGYYFYFDYLWPLAPQDVPDPQKEYPDVSLAIDFDTDHGYKKPPAWHLWHLQKLGFNGHADVYMGVFWNNKRRRVAATYPYATIEYALADGVAAPQAGEVVSISVSGSAMNHTVLAGESLQDIASGMRVLINQFSGVWADDNYGTSTTLRIQSKAPSWSFPGLAVPDGKARLQSAAEPFALTAGANDALQFTIGGEGGIVVAVTLTAGAAQTAARVAADIQAAFDAAGAPGGAQASGGVVLVWSTRQIDTNDVPNSAWITLGMYGTAYAASILATVTDHLGDVGDEGDWELIDSVSPVMTEGARKWIRDLASQFAAAGIPASFAFSMEVSNPPAAMRAKYLSLAGGVVAPGQDVFLNVPSHQMHFGMRVRNYLKQMYKECADEIAAAGLPVVLQFGETQWWYFDNRLADAQGGMPFYDQETIDAFAAAKGHQIWPFTSNTDDPAGDPAHPNESADFLRDRIWSYCQDVISYVRASHPAALFECLWPLDANQGKPGVGTYRRLLMHVNLPREWQNSSYGIKYFRCEGFDYDIWQKNATLMGQTIRFGAQTLGRPASECMYLAGLYGPPDPPMAQAYGMWLQSPFYSMSFWAFDQFCLNSRPIPLEVWVQSVSAAYHKPRAARAAEVARVVEIVAPAGGALNRFKLNDRKLNHG